MKRIIILALPIVLVACVEVLFRLGAWNLFAERHSHAGKSIELRRSLLSPALPELDFVTLGSSRPLYGIDHERTGDEAKQNGMMHANLSMPGTHWMTIGVLSNWLQEHHPEIKGGVIGLSVQDFGWKSNGYYELGIVQPFRTSPGDAWISARNPFVPTNMESFGSRLALFAWRDDIRAFVAHPFSRLNRIRQRRNYADAGGLSENPNLPNDMCTWGLTSIASCDKIESSNDSSLDLRAQCHQIRDTLAARPNIAELMLESPVPEFMESTRALIQSQLRSMNWAISPVVVLMPIPRIWKSEGHDRGIHQWTLKILEPLVADGTIRLIDATDFFDSKDAEECVYFADLYHQSTKGRTEFSDWLLPQLAELLYVEAAERKP